MQRQLDAWEYSFFFLWREDFRRWGFWQLFGLNFVLIIRVYSCGVAWLLVFHLICSRGSQQDSMESRSPFRGPITELIKFNWIVASLDLIEHCSSILTTWTRSFYFWWPRNAAFSHTRKTIDWAECRVPQKIDSRAKSNLEFAIFYLGNAPEL